MRYARTTRITDYEFEITKEDGETCSAKRTHRVAKARAQWSYDANCLTWRRACRCPRCGEGRCNGRCCVGGKRRKSMVHHAITKRSQT